MTESRTAVSSDYVDYSPGNVIGRKYRLERLLDEGAQGSVWLAQNVPLGARVAIKLVHAEPGDPTPILRLEKEARAAAQIAHPSVVRIFDLGRMANGDTFIVMEFLEGDSLADCLAAHGRFSAVAAVRTLLPIADVLHVAHERGIVHRDLKPANVFLSKSGESIQPKLVDFGIAKLQNPKRDEPVITQVGMMIGSPAYASPEQTACSDDVGKEADVWSFCVVLYECVTGAVPFDAHDCRELFRQIREDEPRPILAHGVGELELWEIIRRGLSKSPAERWPSMQALGQALAMWLDIHGVHEDISGVVVASKWLGKSHSEPTLAPDAFDPPSFVRRIEGDRTQGARPIPPTKTRRRPSVLGYVAAAAVLAAAVTGFAQLPGFVQLPWSTQAKPSEAELAMPIAVSDPVEPYEAPATVTPIAAPTTEASLPSTPVARLEVPQAPSPDAGVPAQRRVRREPDSDLLNPY